MQEDGFRSVRFAFFLRISWTTPRSAHLPPVPSASVGCTTAASAALALHSGPLACAVHVPLSSPRPVSANASQEAPSSASHCFVLVDGSLLPPAAPCNFHFRSTLALRRLLHWSRACLMARPLSTCSLDSPCPSPPLPKGCPPPGLFPPMAAVSVFRCSCFRPPPSGGPADACRSRCRSTIIQRFKALRLACPPGIVPSTVWKQSPRSAGKPTRQHFRATKMRFFVLLHQLEQRLAFFSLVKAQQSPPPSVLLPRKEAIDSFYVSKHCLRSTGKTMQNQQKQHFRAMKMHFLYSCINKNTDWLSFPL